HGPGARVFSTLSYPSVGPVDGGTRRSTERRTWLARFRTAAPSPKALPSGSRRRFRRRVGLLALATFLHTWRCAAWAVCLLRGARCLFIYFHDSSPSEHPWQPAYRSFVSHFCRCHSRIVAFHTQHPMACALRDTSLAYCRW